MGARVRKYQSVGVQMKTSRSFISPTKFIRAALTQCLLNCIVSLVQKRCSLKVIGMETLAHILYYRSLSATLNLIRSALVRRKSKKYSLRQRITW